MQNLKTAAIIIIGNEILSGRTKDENVNYLAKELSLLGVSLNEVIVIPDVEATIIEKVLYYSKNFDYVLTTGGIGPTHDDITAESVAKAFGLKHVLSEEAKNMMAKWYEGRHPLTEERLRMAMVPEGARLIINKETAAPGFVVENVYVMAGVPYIMRAMFEELKPELKGNIDIFSVTIDVKAPESEIAKELRSLQAQYKEVDMGSYPYSKEGIWGTEICFRGTDIDQIDYAKERFVRYLRDGGVGFEEK